MELMRIDTMDGKHPITVAVADLIQATRLEQYLKWCKEQTKRPVFTITEQKEIEQ